MFSCLFSSLLFYITWNSPFFLFRFMASNLCPYFYTYISLYLSACISIHLSIDVHLSSIYIYKRYIYVYAYMYIRKLFLKILWPIAFRNAFWLPPFFFFSWPVCGVVRTTESAMPGCVFFLEARALLPGYAVSCCCVRTAEAVNAPPSHGGAAKEERRAGGQAYISAPFSFIGNVGARAPELQNFQKRK